MSTVGSELPAHLLAKRKRQAEDGEKGSTVIHNQSRVHSRSPDSTDGEKRRRVIGPSLPPAALEERPSGDPTENGSGSSSDDDFGPALPARQVSQADDEAESLRQKALADDATRHEAAKKIQRDNWMLEPPKQDDWSSRVDPTKLRNRKFNTGKGSKAPISKGNGDNTVWTETPDQKRQRLEDEVMGVRKPAALGAEDKKTALAQAEAEETARKINDYNVRNRNTSLYSEHKKAVPKEKEDDPSKRAFDKEKDIGGGMKIGHAQKKEMLNRAADFGSRFAGACSFPIIVRRFPRLPVPHHFLFISRHFGTGVLIATAFVHLLPTAFVSLTDPCLPHFWNQGYPAMAGLVAMTSVLIVVGIEMFFATRGAGHMHGSEYDTLRDEDEGHKQKHRANGRVRPTHQRQVSLRPFRQAKFGVNGHLGDIGLEDMEGSSEHLVNEQPVAIPIDSPHSDHDDYRNPQDDSDADLDLDELDPSSDAAGLMNGAPSHKSHAHSAPDTDHQYQRPRLANRATPHAEEAINPQSTLSTQQQQQKMLLQCLLLEAGILFHSVFIGMALSVATGTSFIVLLVAISFHQTFEGLALGSRIAAITSFAPTSPKPWLMALAYGTTTPVGQAIGLLVHNLYDPASQTGLLMVGVMNAISSGLLLFAGLVELLAEDFLSDKSYEVLTGRRRLEACGAVVGGGMLMALVGAWA